MQPPFKSNFPNFPKILGFWAPPLKGLLFILVSRGEVVWSEASLQILQNRYFWRATKTSNMMCWFALRRIIYDVSWRVPMKKIFKKKFKLFSIFAHWQPNLLTIPAHKLIFAHTHFSGPEKVFIWEKEKNKSKDKSLTLGIEKTAEFWVTMPESKC